MNKIELILLIFISSFVGCGLLARNYKKQPDCPECPRCVKLMCIDNEVIVSGECVELEGNWLKLKKKIENDNENK